LKMKEITKILFLFLPLAVEAEAIASEKAGP